MSVQDRLSRLQALLQRVQRRASVGRGPEKAESFQRSSHVESSFLEPGEPFDDAVPLVRVASVAPPAAAPVMNLVRPAFPASSVPPLEPSGVRELPPDDDATLEVVESAPLEQLSEEDLVEMSSDVLESVPPPPLSEEATSSHSQRGEDAFDELEPPASSRRPRIATTLHEVLGFSRPESDRLDDDSDDPVMTPPPESGPQQAPLLAGIAAPWAPDVDALLEADLQPPRDVTGLLPTAEQLGQTIELEEARGPVLELDSPGIDYDDPGVVPMLEELEVTLPFGSSLGRYDQNLELPAAARQELAAHRERMRESNRPSEADTETASSISWSDPIQPEIDAERAPPPHAEVVERPPLSGVNAISMRSSVAAQRASTFVEILDASLNLGGS